mgnify:CR=1 FL=1
MEQIIKKKYILKILIDKCMGNIFIKCVNIDKEKEKENINREGYLIEKREKYYIIMSNNDYIEL